MKHLAFALALLATAAACDGANPMELSPSFDNGALGSGGGRSDDGGLVGSGGRTSTASTGIVGSGGGRSDDGGQTTSSGLVGSSGGRSDDGTIGSGVGS